ncbi:MAG TPA: LysM peptidoglycan-binding domain-containing protein [Gammaproteobacteria bacterium]|nr:LysM peptidoglycan-binding domain-containing protein [Gammaproteobacteria bacterium]
MKLKTLLGVALAVLLTGVALADTIALNPNHPDRYVVVKGDTLWDIAGRFLKDPWHWPEVWYVNPQIKNPHLIYPGDVITLSYVNGKPRLAVQRGRPTVKLSPHARPEPLTRAIPTIPIDAIQQFLTQPLVTDKNELKNAPYVVEIAQEHVIGGPGDQMYVRGLKSSGHTRYSVYRPGKPLVDPDTNEVLGYQAIFVGDATLKRFGDPSTLVLTKADREALVGDRVRPVSQEQIKANFMPHAPKQHVDGRIISVLGGVSQIGQYQVVVLNRGRREGLNPGTVLAIYQTGRVIRDTVSDKHGDTVKLPDERAGELMVFRSFDRVSYGLVMRATRALHVEDRVRNP